MDAHFGCCVFTFPLFASNNMSTIHEKQTESPQASGGRNSDKRRVFYPTLNLLKMSFLGDLITEALSGIVQPF